MGRRAEQSLCAAACSEGMEVTALSGPLSAIDSAVGTLWPFTRSERRQTKLENSLRRKCHFVLASRSAMRRFRNGSLEIGSLDKIEIYADHFEEIMSAYESGYGKATTPVRWE